VAPEAEAFSFGAVATRNSVISGFCDFGIYKHAGIGNTRPRAAVHGSFRILVLIGADMRSMRLICRIWSGAVVVSPIFIFMLGEILD
jgi:hypothetical protein